jgi:hypothetical protein
MMMVVVVVIVVVGYQQEILTCGRCIIMKNTVGKYVLQTGVTLSTVV